MGRVRMVARGLSEAEGHTGRGCLGRSGGDRPGLQEPQVAVRCPEGRVLGPVGHLRGIREGGEHPLRRRGAGCSGDVPRAEGPFRHARLLQRELRQAAGARGRVPVREPPHTRQVRGEGGEAAVVHPGGQAPAGVRRPVLAEVRRDARFRASDSLHHGRSDGRAIIGRVR